MILSRATKFMISPIKPNWDDNVYCLPEPKLKYPSTAIQIKKYEAAHTQCKRIIIKNLTKQNEQQQRKVIAGAEDIPV